MIRRFYVWFFVVLIVSLFQIHCSVPHRVLPHKDIQPSELNQPSLDKKILVASRSSEFKQAIVDKIKEAFQEKPVYVKFIGVREIKKEDAAQYHAIVMINTCMSWDMDRSVHGFLDRYKDHSNMIVLTTSGDGGWLPKMKGRNFDAISSASKKVKIDEVANKIIDRINSLID
jgi:hypothetical protein